MRLFVRLSVIALLAVSNPASAQISVPLTEENLAGAYLAARTAAVAGNHREAALHFQRVLRADPDNFRVIPDATLAFAAIGDWDQAGIVASRLPDGADGQEFADMVQQVLRIRDGNYSDAYAASQDASGAGPLVDPLLQGWLALAEGNMSRAGATFQSLVDSDHPVSGLVPYQYALALASVGDFEGANEIFSGAVFGPLQVSVRGVHAHAQILVQLDRHEDALDLINAAVSRSADPGLFQLRDQIEADPTRPYDFITTPAQGMAEVFFAISRALGNDAGTTLPLVYAHAAFAIDPNHRHAVVLAGNILSDAEQYEMASDSYSLVPREDPLFVEAEMGRAEALYQLGNQEAAVEVLHALARDYPDLAAVHTALGDILRRMDLFEEAILAYDAAVNLIDRTQQRYWFLFYARAISHDQVDHWEAAEADFRHALTLDPDQPNVLNYLGYSLVEQRRNFDEALDMIERAVAGRPSNGYIVDSLGWVLYRLGRFEEAVAPMERAVELMPNDPIINDHLGDVYWMVGRYREAEFQWSRSLSFEPDEVDAERIRLKLEVGLDAVLAAESEAEIQ